MEDMAATALVATFIERCLSGELDPVLLGQIESFGPIENEANTIGIEFMDGEMVFVKVDPA